MYETEIYNLKFKPNYQPGVKGKGHSKEKWTLNYGFINEFKKRYAKNKNDAMNLLLSCNFSENYIDRYIYMYSNFIGMPELSFLLDDEAFQSDMRTSAIMATVNSLLSFDIEKCENMRKTSVNNAVKTYISKQIKHACTETSISWASNYYPRLTRYYFEMMVLAHKGGINDYLYKYTDNEIRDCVNCANSVNHEISIRKNKDTSLREISTKQAGSLKEVFQRNDIIISKGTSESEYASLIEGISDKYFKEDQIARLLFYKMAYKEVIKYDNQLISDFKTNGFDTLSSMRAKTKSVKNQIKEILNNSAIEDSTEKVSSNTSSLPTTDNQVEDSIDFTCSVESSIKLCDIMILQDKFKLPDDSDADFEY